jgi:ribosome-binding protein aMBF1 (putative translation factor)
MAELTEHQKARGWVECSVAEFLGLSEAEEQLIEIKINLAQAVREAREKAGMTQAELAERLETKQPAIARLESAEGKSATIDKMLLALLEIGVARKDVAKIIRDAEPPKFGEKAEVEVRIAA